MVKRTRPGTVVAKTGDRVVRIGPCGGGYGDPLERDPQQVLEDVRTSPATRRTFDEMRNGPTPRRNRSPALSLFTMA